MVAMQKFYVSLVAITHVL